MERKLRISLLSLLLAGSFAGAARADDACAGDRDRLCAEARGLHGKMACMKAHEAELSDACKAQRAAVTQALEEVHADCKTDADRLCQGVVPGRGRIGACLKSHRDEVSDACKQAVGAARSLKEQIHPGCEPDAQRFCQGIAPGGGRILACLISHKAELQPVCAEKLARHASR